MNASPENERAVGGTVDSLVEGTRAESRERFEIPAKGLFALAMGALWLEWKTFRDPLDPFSKPLGGPLKPEDQKKVEKSGWLATAFEKAQQTYGAMAQVEDWVNKGKGIGDILKEGLPKNFKK